MVERNFHQQEGGTGMLLAQRKVGRGEREN